MNKKRESLWTVDIKAKYTDMAERKEREAKATRNGEPVAENLEAIWVSLSQEERHLIEYLSLSGKRALVAFFDDGLFSGLMTKGLLHIPQGVSTVFIQSHQTTYTIPRAVWKLLQERSNPFHFFKGTNKEKRIETLSHQFENRIEALLTNKVLEADV